MGMIFIPCGHHSSGRAASFGGDDTVHLAPGAGGQRGCNGQSGGIRKPFGKSHGNRDHPRRQICRMSTSGASGRDPASPPPRTHQTLGMYLAGGKKGTDTWERQEDLQGERGRPPRAVPRPRRPGAAAPELLRAPRPRRPRLRGQRQWGCGFADAPGAVPAPRCHRGDRWGRRQGSPWRRSPRGCGPTPRPRTPPFLPPSSPPTIAPIPFVLQEDCSTAA